MTTTGGAEGDGVAPGHRVEPIRNDPFVLDLRSNMANQTDVVWNVRQTVVVTTRHKIELALRRVLPRYLPNEVWVAPASFLVAVAASLVSAEFKTFAGVPGSVWMSLFIVAGLFSIGWLVRALFRYAGRASLTDVVTEVVDTGDLTDTTPPAMPSPVPPGPPSGR